MSPVPRVPVPDVDVSATLLEIPDPLHAANRLRYLPTSELEGVTAEILRHAARRCRAASYSLLTAARRFEHRAELLESPT